MVRAFYLLLLLPFFLCMDYNDNVSIKKQIWKGRVIFHGCFTL